MRPILNSPRVLRTGQPLTLEGIRQAAPAVFAKSGDSKRSSRYLYVPTEAPVRALMEVGWGIYEVSQQRPRSPEKDSYAKHMLRMRKLTDFDLKAHTSAEGVAEVILINAHDGTAKYHLKAGYFRFVCSNGIISGTNIAGFSVQHSIGTTQEVIEAGERVVVESFPRMLESIEKFKTIKLDTSYSYRLAEKAFSLRHVSGLSAFTPQDLLATRRQEDENPTLWNILNRVQENTIYGGFEVRSAGYGRRSSVRPVERVSAVTHINEGIWNEAEAIYSELS